jgi:hypothetical protein
MGNKIDIQIDELSRYFKDHTLQQCADRYDCSKVTIKRRLQAAGVDTSIHNHSDLAKRLCIESIKTDTSMLTKEFLIEHYLKQNKDTKTIAEELGLHFNTVRTRIRSYGLKKDAKNVSASMQVRYMKKTGYMHPGHNPINIAKINKARSRYRYNSDKTSSPVLFKSLHELSYALLLDNDDDVESWDYELIKIPYMDVVKKRMRMYYIDFSIQCKVKSDRWIEVKPARNMIPHMKRLYASYNARRAGIEYRGLTEEERAAGFELFKSGYNCEAIEFVNASELKLDRCYTLWFKDIADIRKVKHDHYCYKDKVGPYYRAKFKAKSANKSVSI